jgi:hypothetical protein
MLNKEIRANGMGDDMCDLLRTIPIIIDWADKVAYNVVTNATFLLPIGSKPFS